MRNWKNTIKIIVQEIGQKGLDCTDVAQDRNRWRAVLKTAPNLQVP